MSKHHLQYIFEPFLGKAKNFSVIKVDFLVPIGCESKQKDTKSIIGISLRKRISISEMLEALKLLL